MLKRFCRDLSWQQAAHQRSYSQNQNSSHPSSQGCLKSKTHYTHRQALSPLHHLVNSLVIPSLLLSSAPKWLKNFSLLSLVLMALQHSQPVIQFRSLRNDESTRESHYHPILITDAAKRDFVLIVMMRSDVVWVVLAGCPSFWHSYLRTSQKS